ncbi:MAG TPA: MarR family transcriptional regulator [Caldimonas sp.]|jgi:DNA-binding MarR family transcriptional regulator|nr:MarR family transcriptional regulator [Caldimonas sp.]HEX2542222.1 MarR family transcriptional regulator [Caldimonas sp.]
MQSHTLKARRAARTLAGAGEAAASPSSDTATAGEAPATTAFVDDYLPALLAQASQLISAEFHAVVRRQGLSISEWRVLATLADSPRMSIGRLASIALAKQPTVTRLLDRMQEKGHVRRTAHDSDRRVTLVGITPAGRQLVQRLIVLAREHEDRVLAPFGLARADALKTTLRRIIDLHKPTAE